MTQYGKTSLRSLFHLQSGIEPALPDESCNRKYYYERNLPNQCMCDFCFFDKENYRSRFKRE